jgi:hypothetical protein
LKYLYLFVTAFPQLEGTIIAPTNAKSWGGGLLQWLEFTKLRGITIRGNGVIEGRGSVWWTGTDDDIDPVHDSMTFLSLLFVSIMNKSLKILLQ